MDNVFLTLLVNTILQGKNPNLWKGDCIISEINPSLLWMTRESRKSRLDKISLKADVENSKVDYVESKCWVPSGDVVDRYDICFHNMSARLIFEKDKTSMQIELKNYLVDRRDYDVTYVASERLVSRLVETSKLIERIETEWPDVVRESVKKAKNLELRAAAIRGYMDNNLRESCWTYDIRVTSECTVVSLVAEGKLELTTSLVASDDIFAKLGALIDEMRKKLFITA